MSWDDIKKGYGKVASKTDSIRTSTMSRIDNRGAAPRARTGSDAADAEDGPAAPPPHRLPPRTGGPSAIRSTPAAPGAAAAANGSSHSGIFANLSEADKEDFFALLDEYFESRPHLLGGDEGSTTDPVAAAAAKHGPALASAALRNPGLTAAAMRSQGVSPGVASSISTAAAGLAAKKPPPPAPAAVSAPVTPPQRGPKGAAGLTSGKSIGNLPTTSGKAAFGHILTNTGRDKPPPDNSFSSDAATAARVEPPVRAAAAAPPPPPSRTRGVGNAVALYDFQGTDAGDLSFSEGDQITILEFVSDDWHKGELANGQSGIYPANYVQVQ